MSAHSSNAGIRRDHPIRSDQVNRLTRCAIPLALLAVAAPLAAQEAPPQPTQPATHEVRPGDTLWDLSRTYLRDPFRWPEIHRANQTIVANPHLIFPRQHLRIPGLDRPAAPGVAAAAPGQEGAQRTIFFEREARRDAGPEMTIRPAGTADVPIITEGDFLSSGFVAQPGEVAVLGRVAGVEAESVVPSRFPPQVQLYDRIYVTVDGGARMGPGDEVHLMALGAALPHGTIHRPTGIGRVVSLERNVATVEVVRLFGVVAAGNVAVSLPAFPVAAGVAPVEASGIEGRIVRFQDEHALQMTENIAFLDLGRASGVREGDEFLVYTPARQRSWGVQPEVEIAHLQVVRVMDRTASARVDRVLQPALEAGLPVRVTRRMP
jgi:hypothetical protein